MKKFVSLAWLLVICAGFIGTTHAFNWGKVKEGARDMYEGAVSPGQLSNAEVIRGLRQALEIGTKNATSIASKVNGYYKNPRIFIPFPPEAKKVKTVAETLGMKKQVKDFVRTLNRAAEEAAKEAAPIFIGAIKQMTIQDGFRILNGPDDAATQYLKRKQI